MTTSKGESGRSRCVKLALIPILAVVLIVILTCSDDSAGTNHADSPKPGQKESASLTGSPKGDLAAERTSPRKQPSWPRITLGEILRHDPFAVPTTLGASLAHDGSPRPAEPTDEELLAKQIAEKAARREKLVATLKQKRVKVVLLSDDGAAAVIDSEIVRKGDRLQDGARIVEIRPEGVIVELAE